MAPGGGANPNTRVSAARRPSAVVIRGQTAGPGRAGFIGIGEKAAQIGPSFLFSKAVAKGRSPAARQPAGLRGKQEATAPDEETTRVSELRIDAPPGFAWR